MRIEIDGAARLARERAQMSLSFAQLIAGLATEEWITEAEMDGWLAGTVPAPVAGLLAQLPAPDRYFAKARAVRPSVVMRTDPLVDALAVIEGKTPEQIDNFFLTYAAA